MKALGLLRFAAAAVVAAAAWTSSFAQEMEASEAEAPLEQAAEVEAAVEQAAAVEAAAEQAAEAEAAEAPVEQAAEKPVKTKPEKAKKEKPEKVKAEGKSNAPLWAAVSLDVVGAGLVVAGIVANDKVSQYVIDDNVKGAKLWKSRRDLAYIAGAALLAGGITIHILF